MESVRVRYAPSPTGNGLHIGNARTAFFNYLFAYVFKGSFIIRIEDTDIYRNVIGSEEKQLLQLKWLGLNWSEGPDVGGSYGPYRQSERLSIYNKYTKLLLEKNLAYKVYSNNDKKDYIVRFRVPKDQQYSFVDLIRGPINFASKDIEDWIILKENGYPTYNYAVAIDDYLMKISHILRGEEHITNTPKQIMIYKAFNWEIPVFAHMSLIFNQHKQKMSKRNCDDIQFIEQYRNLGYLPEAILNFLFFLGFSPKTNQTILNKDLITNLFDIKRFSKDPAIFDISKLNFLNKEYLKKISLEELAVKVNFCFQQFKIYLEHDRIIKLVVLLRDRIYYIQEIIDLYKYFFVIDHLVTQELKFFLIEHKGYELIPFLLEIFNKLDIFKSSELKKIILNLKQNFNMELKILFKTVRILCTCQSQGPNLFDYLELLGKDKILKNLEKFTLIF
ncbi:MAG: glutamate--tRNA ligase [Pigeon pea little leaf phytoplasma]|uniref:Glutamate--tRNA ligase n=1 Tax=Candidatus Phytoplasma fabacearum TaxID=2982628 RepID=A0ABU8ZS33_9MOLU|nr:glutamate--tRNA ligase ['Bituminaria bituminosa' little leaf phytoplasma]MDV3148763.1 glutamate--tRNA ligase [Pigeon pea little leaf phytoplasma]MDO7983502.1 glutamate--tRNA ligase ['Bituminaria bituminosa' little leaf phytoplasma]MDO8023794.1 glutamate--tRNA ligase ['Bituminaria bituminosa' little leaf phytoplasma]MDO8030622.1 glutamate--tRNA ligase ['Bituminaria bituminosa' little leaf phytoplasma]MDV3154189.1 glutamate--tRNA ligase [Pigeon pea little leaf phytoplasma]